MELYSFRKGNRKFEQQIDVANVSTRTALMQILFNFSHHISDQSIIVTNIRSYHYFDFKDNIDKSYILGLNDIESSDDVNDFLEIIIRTLYLNHHKVYYNTGEVDDLIIKINSMLKVRSYMYFIDKESFKVIAYIDEMGKEAIEEMLEVKNDVRDYLIEAFSNLKKNSGTAVHKASSGLEEFFKVELKLAGKTLGHFISSLKKDNRYIALNLYTQKYLDETLEEIQKSRNDGKSAGHPGNTVLSHKEAIFIIMSIVNIINLLR